MALGGSVLVLLVTVSQCGLGFAALPSTFPTAYPGMPSGDYSPQWQTYFQVTAALPGINFELGNNYAGNIAVQRPNHPNDTLFFWGFEHSEGSLTAGAGQNSDQPWAIWLQGGPGDSSFMGLTTENGPIRLVPGTRTFTQPQYAWNNLIDYIWVEQPVGVGFSTADSTGYPADENQVGTDFVGFLENLVKVFPSLATRPLYLTGESYAGRFIPYIAKTLFSMSNPPVQLSKIMIGDPGLGSNKEFKIMPTVPLLETYPQLIGYDTDVFDYFKQQSHLCNLDINLTYPQTGGPFPPVQIPAGARTAGSSTASTKRAYRGRRSLTRELAADLRAAARDAQRGSVPLAKRQSGLAQWKQGHSADSTVVDPWYGCDVWDEMIDFAMNFTFPWAGGGEFDEFDVPDALNPEVSDDPFFFFREAAVVSALHAPTDVKWAHSFDIPWGNKAGGPPDPSPETMTFLTDLATNFTKHGVHFLTYVGNDDGISPHFGTEVTIQNTTFGGIQGFTRRPSTPWWDVEGNWAGIVHQERNWTYALIQGAGHEVPALNPAAAYTFVKEFLVGNSQTGLVQTSGGTTSVVGGENPTLAQAAVPGQPAIFYGSSSTEGSIVWPAATVAAFESHVGLVKVTGTDAMPPAAT